MAKTVQEMSNNLREKKKFTTVLRAYVNEQATKLSVGLSNKSPICDEIMLSVQPNHKHATDLNPESIVAMLETGETIEPPQITELRARLGTELLSLDTIRINVKKKLRLRVFIQVFRHKSKANSLQ